MYIGIDIGGTNIVAAIVSDDGEILKRAHTPTNAKEGTETVIGNYINVVEQLLQNNELPLRSIGVGVPGAVRSDIGTVVFSPNLPLKNTDIAAPLREKFGCDVYIGNDANCAVLGEAVAGSGKGCGNVAMITLGTGLGGGFVIGGELVTGISGAAGEIGHTVIATGGRQCGCGRKGCWEAYSSATGLSNMMREQMEKDDNSLMWELCMADTDKVNGKMVFDAYRAKDSSAITVVNAYIGYLAIGIVNIINLLEPDIICVGGGISNAWEYIEQPLTAAVETEKFTRFSEGVPHTKLVRATLGNDAGIIGAAMLGKTK